MPPDPMMQSPQPGMQPQQPQPQASGPGGATMPSPNAGLQMQAQARLAILSQQIQSLFAIVPVDSEMARDMREALNKLAKHIGPMSKGVQTSAARQQTMHSRQQQIASMRENSPVPAAAQPMMPGMRQ